MTWSGRGTLTSQANFFGLTAWRLERCSNFSCYRGLHVKILMIVTKVEWLSVTSTASSGARSEEKKICFPHQWSIKKTSDEGCKELRGMLKSHVLCKNLFVKTLWNESMRNCWNLQGIFYFIFIDLIKYLLDARNKVSKRKTCKNSS